MQRTNLAALLVMVTLGLSSAAAEVGGPHEIFLSETRLDTLKQRIDQRRFAIGFEMLLAYANIAWLEKNEAAVSGIIRRDYCDKVWKEKRTSLPLRDGEVGQHLDADLLGYFEQLENLIESDMADALRWLCVDRAVARHFQVAARKLVQHDTFRLIEDEEGVRATDKFPIADVAIRIDSMLSLIADVKLLTRTDDGYVIAPATQPWYDEQIARIASSMKD